MQKRIVLCAEALKLTVCHLLFSFSLPSCVYCVCHFEDTRVCAVSILKFLLNFFCKVHLK